MKAAPQRLRASLRSGTGEHRLAVVVATKDSCLRVIDAAAGRPLGDHWMVPKTKEPLLACIPLAADGFPSQVNPVAVPQKCTQGMAVAES